MKEETIFDHNPTLEEIQEICPGMTPEECDKLSPDANLELIACLYKSRGQDSLCKRYIDQIKDPTTKMTLLLLLLPGEKEGIVA